MAKKNKAKDIKLIDDYTSTGLIIAVGGSIFIIFISVLMIYISTPPQKIYVAKVNGKGIMRLDYDRSVNNSKRMYVQMMKMDFTDPKNQAQLTSIKQNSFDNVINRELLLQYATKNSITVEKDVVDAEIKKIKDENFKAADEKASEKMFKDYLKQAGLTSSQFYETVEKDKLIEKVKNTIEDEKIKISDKEIKDYYEKNTKEFTTPEQVKASHILVKDEAKAKELYETLKKEPKKFEELAKANSTDPGSKDKGGDLGFFGKGQMVKEFEETAWNLQKDEISEPVKSQFGYHIIKKIDQHPEKVETFENSKKKIKDNLKQKQSKDVMDKFLKELKAAAQLEIFDEELKPVPSPSPSTSASSSAKPEEKKVSSSPAVQVSVAPENSDNKPKDKKEEPKKEEKKDEKK
ncbi:MAG: peptidylprolyl isomerase [Candidatus Sericytochromatia bacterium]